MLFKIGEVAKMQNISHDTLRYYDKIGLLKPSTKKNRYRYYTISDLKLLDMILLAKEVGISMEYIKNTVASGTELDYIELLKKCEIALNDKISKLNKLKKEI